MQYLLYLGIIFTLFLVIFLMLFKNIVYPPTEFSNKSTNSFAYLNNINAGSTSDLSLIPNIANVTISWIDKYGYIGVFAAALIENLFPPIPSELVFPLAGIAVYAKNLGLLDGVIGMSLSGAAGSTVGASIIYYISRRIGRMAILKLGTHIGFGESELKKAEKWFDKHGSMAVFFGRMVPGLREIVSIPAGIEKMKLSSFTTFTFAGSFVWCTFLTTIGFFMGDMWNELYKKYSLVFDLVAIIVLVGILGGVSYRYYKHKTKS